MFTAFWGEQQAAVAIVESSRRPVSFTPRFNCFRRDWVSSLCVEERRPLRRQSDEHHFGSLLVLAVTAGSFLLVTWVATKALFVFVRASPIP
jgi:hypothetical protein